jgi:two-component system phosphate regulon sensor histidine kinase PhoR
LPNLIARRAAEETGALGKLDYTVKLSDSAEGKLIAGEKLAEATRIRHFERADNLFPNLSFGVAAPALKTTDVEDFTRSSILLGLGAAMLSLVGLALTWRATRREMRVAQLKSDFLASISHELKTPLTAIRAFGDLIHSGRARDAVKIREYGAIIKTESDRLTALINNILEISRLERGLQRYRLEEGFLCATIAETVKVFRHTAGIGNYQVKVELPSSPIKAKFDENAIRQALLNLLSNAVKYSGENNYKQIIEVALRREKSVAVIEVRDFGIGITPAEQRHIFKAFHRASQSEVQAERGTGLGLAIVREIARAHGGEVSVESELGAGAVFRLHLPYLVDAAEQPAPTIIEIDKDEEYLGYRGRT